MSIEATTAPTGPTAGVAAVTFRFPDPDHRPVGVRLVRGGPGARRGVLAEVRHR